MGRLWLKRFCVCDQKIIAQVLSFEDFFYVFLPVGKAISATKIWPSLSVQEFLLFLFGPDPSGTLGSSLMDVIVLLGLKN